MFVLESYCTTYGKTHDSESKGQGRSGPYVTNECVIYMYSTAVKFVNALNKLPLQLSLSYQGLSTF